MKTRSSSRTILAAGAVAIIALAACTGSGTSSSVPAASVSVMPSLSESAAPVPTGTPLSSAEPTDDLGPFTCEFPIENDGSVSRAQITDVRVGEHADYDRVVVEFADGIPPFTISEVSPPLTADPSGLPLGVDGTYFWQLVLNGGTTVTPEGELTYDGPRTFTPGFAQLVQLVEGGDFEAVSTWYMGTSADTCIRVLQLNAPARLVLDLQH